MSVVVGAPLQLGLELSQSQFESPLALDAGYNSM